MSEKRDIASDPYRIGESAMCELAEMSIPPVPLCYKVWFAHLEKNHHDLSSEIEEQIASQKHIDEYFLNDIHAKYFEVTQPTKKIENFTIDMLRETNTLKVLANTFGSSAKEFREDLSSLSQKAEEVTDSNPDTEELLLSMVSAAQKAVEQNSELEEKLSRALEQITSLQKSLGRITADASTDALTKLNNRRYFDSSAPDLFAATHADKKSLCFIIADIDHFRQFNDKWGHKIGDQVLKLVADVLRENVKGQDLFARYGGNEFVLALPNRSLTEAITLADNIRVSVGKRKLINKTTNDNLGRITMSFGVTEMHKAESPGELFKIADTALQKAKEQGRNCVVSLNSTDCSSHHLQPAASAG